MDSCVPKLRPPPDYQRAWKSSRYDDVSKIYWNNADSKDTCFLYIRLIKSLMYVVLEHV